MLRTAIGKLRATLILKAKVIADNQLSVILATVVVCSHTPSTNR
jgi:hypothetical protein